MGKKVFLGMSGGVDSSVSAYLLKKAGYDVVGVTMQVWQDDDYYKGMEGTCCSLSAVEDARGVAYKLGIPFYVMNFRDEFKKKVIDYFVSEYKKGHTPNPCITCNKYIKFDLFLKEARSIGADYIATGHYAKIENVNGRYLLKKSDDDRKDQTYVLYNLSQEVLSHTLMPCGDYEKTRIREIAKEEGLEVYNKRDSEEICFIPDNNHGDYIKRVSKGSVREGNFVDKDGNVLGRHKGIVYYTIGQRKGLGIALGKPVFVTGINAEKNEVILGSEDEIFKDELIADDMNFIPFDDLKEKMKVNAKVRYNARPCSAEIEPLGNGRVRVKFDEKQRAITKGQSVVFYKDNIVVGGGTIREII